MTQIKITAECPESGALEVASGVLDKQVFDVGNELYFNPTSVSKGVLVMNTEDDDDDWSITNTYKQYFDLLDPITGHVIGRQVCWLYIQPPKGMEKVANYFGFPKKFPASSSVTIRLIPN